MREYNENRFKKLKKRVDYKQIVVYVLYNSNKILKWYRETNFFFF